jgi:hypothetical protein
MGSASSTRIYRRGDVELLRRAFHFDFLVHRVQARQHPPQFDQISSLKGRSAAESVNQDKAGQIRCCSMNGVVSPLLPEKGYTAEGPCW